MTNGQEMHVPADAMLADVDVELMPELTESVRRAMLTPAVRWWLHRMQESEITQHQAQVLFGDQIAEGMALWLSLQADIDVEIRNCADFGVAMVDHDAPGAHEESGSEESVAAQVYEATKSGGVCGADEGLEQAAGELEAVDEGSAMREGLESGTENGQVVAAEGLR